MFEFDLQKKVHQSNITYTKRISLNSSHFFIMSQNSSPFIISQPRLKGNCWSETQITTSFCHLLSDSKKQEGRPHKTFQIIIIRDWGMKFCGLVDEGDLIA